MTNPNDSRTPCRGGRPYRVIGDAPIWGVEPTILEVNRDRRLAREMRQDLNFGAQRERCDLKALTPRANTALCPVVRQTKTNKGLQLCFVDTARVFSNGDLGRVARRSYNKGD